ncbi:other/TTK protein kinase [Desarmillaria ectypa]|nr:other/TTK protein kinase [Desarmillaria ectypa]
MASTPPQEKREPSTSPASTESSDFSALDLSFEYVYDDDGNYVRLSKGSPKSERQSATYSPASSPLEIEPSSEPVASANNVPGPHGALDSDLVSLTSPRPTSLTRSESAFPILSGHNFVAPERELDRDSAPSMARSFQRVTSGPAIAMSVASASTSAGPKRLFPRRAVDELQEAWQKRNGEELRDRLLSSTADSQGKHMLSYPDEKENIGRGGSDLQSVEELYGLSARAPVDGAPAARLLAPSRPAYVSLSTGTRLASDLASSRRRLSSSNSVSGNRNSRILKGSGKKHMIDRISELDQSTDEEAYGYEQVSDHAHDEGTDLDEPQVESVSRAPSREGVLSLSQSRPRRSTSLSGSDEPYHGSIDGHARSQQFQSRPSRPGTSVGSHRETGLLPRRVTVEEWDGQEMGQRAEFRKYQDVERRLQEQQFREQHHPSQARQSPSPTNISSHVISVNGRPSYATHRRRESDTLKSSVAHSGSPTAVDAPPAKHSPSENNLAASASVDAKHGRSPTAPEPPTTSVNLRNGGAGDDQREKEKERYRQQRQQRQHSTKQASSTGSSQPISTSLSQQQLAAASMGPGNRHLVVNRKLYARLDMIGKGGSSRVYRVMNHANELYAIKRVSLDKIDSETMSGYMNEIALLKRLEGNSRIIGLIDSELKAGPGGGKGHLLLVMECGEIDFARLLSERQSQGLDMVWVAYYWQQMLQAVHVIHEEKIVHSDLKPANFVLVKGQLKLIDFGIANAIANDTTNIQRDHQIGTVNYMSPETIEVPDGMRRHKVGRASDIWSLGCILYQMVYGQPPFHHLAVFQKMKAIPDATHRIDFPLYVIPTVPSSNQKASPGHGPPPKKLEHLKRRIRMDIILSMRSCLNRNPKERMSIPQLLEQDWLAMKDPLPTPTIVDLLGEDETVITPFYMKQLLEYGIRLGKGLGEGKEATKELLEEDAQRLVKELRSLIVKKEAEQ